VLQADGGIQDTFSAIEASSSSSCESVTVGNAVYSSSALSVTLTVNPCPSNGLSSGAIVGIAVGTSAVVALTLVVILWVKDNSKSTMLLLKVKLLTVHIGIKSAR
jgi:hypothetical protein